MTIPFSINRLRLPTGKTGPPLPQKKRPPRHRPGEKFLKGPIPWKWLEEAMKQPGKAVHVGLAIWFWAGVKRTKEISLSLSRLRQSGVDRHSARRGLAVLEQAGLVSVRRYPGRKPVVTLLDGP